LSTDRPGGRSATRAWRGGIDGWFRNAARSRARSRPCTAFRERVAQRPAPDAPGTAIGASVQWLIQSSQSRRGEIGTVSHSELDPSTSGTSSCSLPRSVNVARATTGRCCWRRCGGIPPGVACRWTQSSGRRACLRTQRHRLGRAGHQAGISPTYAVPFAAPDMHTSHCGLMHATKTRPSSQHLPPQLLRCTPPRPCRPETHPHVPTQVVHDVDRRMAPSLTARRRRASALFNTSAQSFASGTARNCPAK